MKQWYEEFFENYAESYDKECFTQGTLGEVDFIEQEIGFDKSKRILDIGCGTGRHAVELAASRNDSLIPNDMEMLVVAENAD